MTIFGKNKKLWALFPIVLFIAAACNDDKPAPDTTTSATKPKEMNAKGSVETPGSAQPTPYAPPTIAPSVPGPGAPPPPDATPKNDAGTAPTSGALTIPASLKTEAFEYEGLANTKPVDMEMVLSTDPGTVVTGSETLSLASIKDGKAVYALNRTGGLEKLGIEEWTLDRDGVYTTKSSMASVSKDAMDLPSTPRPGMKWSYHVKTVENGQTMETDTQCSVIGKEDVKTKGGMYHDALVVRQVGKGTIQSQPIRTEAKNWYVKGLGLVKAEMKAVLPGGKTATYTIQETKH